MWLNVKLIRILANFMINHIIQFYRYLKFNVSGGVTLSPSTFVWKMNEWGRCIKMNDVLKNKISEFLEWYNSDGKCTHTFIMYANLHNCLPIPFLLILLKTFTIYWLSYKIRSYFLLGKYFPIFPSTLFQPFKTKNFKFLSV